MKLRIIGDLDDETVPKSLAKKMRKLMEQTKDNTGLELNVAFNYGGKKEILKATKEIAEEVKNGNLDINDINEEVFANHLYTKGESDPDLVIRTSGEMRTSNFLPW
jgi:undecaprenyl diphosphate synthase